ncbi:unnamed protein product [Tilletia controversa]|nr:hypothetical protein CF328_g1324 [Tilletia controversa]CAD6926987.1 unnamed protein product [Tilletia controversa]CAD6954776.1 unnamed protein product [Tilletia controversa]
MADRDTTQDEQEVRIADEVMRATFGDAAAAGTAYDDDDDALLQAAINASLADQDRVPTSGKRSSSSVSARQQTRELPASSSSHRTESGSSGSARAAASGPIRNKKSRPSSRPESGPSNASSVPSSSSAVLHGSPRRRHRVGTNDHESSTPRLAGWNNPGIRMNADNHSHARTPPTGTSVASHAAGSSSRSGTAIPSGPIMRSRALSSMSVDDDNEHAAAAQGAFSRATTNAGAEEFPGAEQDVDDDLEALMSGPSGARARRRSQAQNGGGRRSFGSGSGTPMSTSYNDRNSGGAGRRSSEHRSPLLGSTSGTGDDSVEFLGGYSAPNARGGSAFAQAGRSADHDVDLLSGSYGSGSARRSPFLHPALRSANLDDIPQDDDDGDLQLGEGMLSSAHRRAADDDEDEFEVMGSHRAGPGSALPRAFGLGQPQHQPYRAENVEGDLDEDFDDDGDAAAATLAHMRAMQSMQSYLTAGGVHAPRNYDDEDEALQAALAASLADAEDAVGGSAHAHPVQGLPEDYDPDAFEAQATAAALSAGMRSGTPPPQDVERIARMREEARRKEQEERDRAERRARGEDVPSPPAAVQETGDPGNDDSSSSSSSDEDDDEDTKERKGDDEPEEVLTAEEMRRRRLARFNA